MAPQAYTAGELDESKFTVSLAMFMDRYGSDNDEDDDQLIDDLVMAAVEPMQRRNLQDIGPEVLSMRRLQREAAALGHVGEDLPASIQARFRFRLEWLPHVVAALNPPYDFDTDGGHCFTGEEGVLLLLRRYGSNDPLQALTWECGRSTSAISEAVWYMACGNGPCASSIDL